MKSYPKIKAFFIERPNQFLVRCRIRGGKEVEAFLPNPDRMWELLLPGTALWLCPTKASNPSGRKTKLTVQAVERDGEPIFLDTTLPSKVNPLEIPWSHLQEEIQDRGSYLLLMKLARQKSIEIGRLGLFPFQKSFYVYVGSAMRQMSARLARHVRKRKKMPWHIDFHRQEAESVVPVPIRSSRHDECEIARAYSKLLAPGPAGFGSSDCGCPTHLFYCEQDPLSDRRFHEILQFFRMRPPTNGPTSPAVENVRRPRSTRRPRTKLPR